MTWYVIGREKRKCRPTVRMTGIREVIGETGLMEEDWKKKTGNRISGKI